MILIIKANLPDSYGTNTIIHSQERAVKKTKHNILFIDPPFHRLCNINASLNMLRLSLAYLTGMVVSRKSNW